MNVAGAVILGEQPYYRTVEIKHTPRDPIGDGLENSQPLLVDEELVFKVFLFLFAQRTAFDLRAYLPSFFLKPRQVSQHADLQHAYPKRVAFEKWDPCPPEQFDEVWEQLRVVSISDKSHALADMNGTILVILLQPNTPPAQTALRFPQLSTALSAKQPPISFDEVAVSYTDYSNGRQTATLHKLYPREVRIDFPLEQVLRRFRGQI